MTIINKIIKEFPNAVELLLNDYSDWLCKHNYMDSDYYTEEPRAIETYLNSKN